MRLPTHQQRLITLEPSLAQTSPSNLNSGFDVFAVANLLEGAVTEDGSRFVDLVERSPVLLVFLRHAGCTFCREALADIAQSRTAIEADGNQIVLVYLGDRAEMDRVIRKYSVESLPRICDPGQHLYRAFGLKRGTLGQLVGPKVWLRAITAGWFGGHGVSRPAADSAQMPGVFWIDKGMIAGRFRHQSAADRPCYTEICKPAGKPTR
ncbi:MAG: SelL-related redox protein [Acidobacteriota bacterium]